MSTRCLRSSVRRTAPGDFYIAVIRDVITRRKFCDSISRGRWVTSNATESMVARDVKTASQRVSRAESGTALYQRRSLKLGNGRTTRDSKSRGVSLRVVPLYHAPLQRFPGVHFWGARSGVNLGIFNLVFVYSRFHSKTIILN
jgi:hypothetical protein